MRTLRILIDNRDGSTYPVSAILPGHPHLTAAVPADAFPRNPPALGQPGLEANGLEAFGEALHAVVCRPALRAAWDAVAGGPARVLLDVRPPELRDLPWELLLDGARQRWMFGNPQQPIVRAAAAAFLDLATPLQLPVRMLVLVGAPEEADRDVLGVDLELEAIYGAVRELGCLWQVDVLDGADQSDVRERLADFAPHILHFVGHGTTDGAGRPALEIARKGQEPQALATQFVVNALANVPPPRLVVLNACRTVDAAMPARSIVHGLAGAFLDLGAAAAVAMQGDVEPHAAAQMSRSLYTAIAADQPLDVAMAVVHDDLHWSQSFRAGDWALPTITVRADPDRILEHGLLTGGMRTLTERAGRFPELKWLVDRTADRHRVLATVAPDAGRAAAPRTEHIAFLTGRELVGKTTVARSCVLVAWQRQLPVVHVDLPPGVTLTCNRFLEAFATAVPESLGTQAAAQAAEVFIAELAQLEAATRYGGPITAPSHGGALPLLPPMPMTPGRTMPGLGERPDYAFRPRTRSAQEVAFDRFRAFLAALAAGQPLLVVIDNVGRMDAEDLKMLREHVFAPAVAGAFAPVRILIVEQPGALDAVLADERLEGCVVPLQPFAKQDVTRLLAEFCARRRTVYKDLDDADWRVLVDGMRGISESIMVDSYGGLVPDDLLRWESIFSRRGRRQ